MSPYIRTNTTIKPSKPELGSDLMWRFEQDIPEATIRFIARLIFQYMGLHKYFALRSQQPANECRICTHSDVFFIILTPFNHNLFAQHICLGRFFNLNTHKIQNSQTILMTLTYSISSISTYIYISRLR